ncbi:MAG: NAD-dependent epimerase/dehydratase family protein [Bacteroidota bacterium]
MILLTGATGFLGNHILQHLLNKDLPVRVLVRNSDQRHLPWRDLVEVYEGDIQDLLAVKRAMEGVETVIHNAAVVSFQSKDKDLLHQVNVKGTATIVDVCLELGVEHMIHVSSIATMGETSEGMIDEDSPRKEPALSHYAESKFLAEIEVYRGIAEGLKAVIVNPGTIIGPTHDWDSGTGQMFASIAKGLKFYVEGSTGWVGAEDVARAIVLLLEQHVPAGERHILVSTNARLIEIFEKIAQHLHAKAPSMKVNMYVAILGAFFNELLSSITGKPSGVTVQGIKSIRRGRDFDGSKILQYGFQYDDLDQVIAKTAQAFLDSQK